ncbi:TOM70 protein, partial [Acromyrmex charruanus]
MRKYNEAIAEYNKAIDICPKENVDDLAIFYQNRAAAYEQLKRYNSAKADCTKALELNPKYTKALLLRAFILEQLGDLETALKDITTACIHKNFSDHASLLKAQIILEKLVKQHFSKITYKIFGMPTTHVIEIYYIRTFSKDPVLSRLEHPENIPEFFKKPLQALKDREYRNIISLCSEIIESPKFDTLPPSKLEVLLLRATFYFIWHHHNAAIHDLEIILSSEDVCDDIRINALIKRANVYLEIGKICTLENVYSLAFKDFELALLINPSCSDIYYHRGLAHKKMQELGKAKRDFEKAIEYNPNFSMAHMQKWHTNYRFALLNGNMCLFKITMRDIEKAIDKYSNSFECVCCYVLYAQIMFEIQQYQKADTYFVKAVEKDPDYAIVYLELWNCNLINIETYLNKALKLDTGSVTGKIMCIEILKLIEIERGNIEEALNLSDKAFAFCHTFEELLDIYSIDFIYNFEKNRFALSIRFLRSYSRFIGIQNAGESDKHIPIDSDGPSKVLSPTAESETPLQRAQKYKNEGNICFKTKKYNEAIVQYTKAIDICPKENKDELAIFYQNRAAAYEQLKKYSSVKADCTKALELNPKHIKALLRRARVLEQTGDLEAALKDMTTVCIHKNFSDQAALLNTEIILGKLVDQVEENMSRENFFMLTTHAIEIYYIRAFSKDPVLSRLEHPENIPEFFKKPLQALKNKEYHNIIPLCTEIIESPEFDKLPSSKLEVVLLRATFNLFRSNYSAAIDDFKIILSREDAFDDIRVNALIKRANLHREIGISHLVFEDFNLAIMINPSCSDIYYHRGQAYLGIQKLDKAKRDFEKAVELNPNFSAAHMQKWYANYHFAVLNGDLNLAEMTVRDVEKAFDIERYSNPPECVCCYVLYAQIMSKTEQYQKADTYFVKAIEKDPDYAIVYLLLWNCNLDNTVEYLNKVLKLETCSNGGKLRCIEMLRTIEIRRGNIEEAIKLSDKALVFCRIFKELLYIYNVDAIKTYLDIQNQFGHVIRFLRSYSQFIDVQNAEESDKRIPIDSDRPSKVSSSTAESETPLQRAQKYKNEGNVYFKMKKYNEAITEYTKAIDICPKENKDELAIFYQNRAAAYEQLKKYSFVKADCTKALELNPKYIKALLRRARVLEQTGDLEAALKDMTTACIYEEFSHPISLVKIEIILKKLVKQHAYENWTSKKSFMPNKPFIECYITSYSTDPVFSKLQCPENIPEFFKKPLQALEDTKYDDVIPLCTEIIESPEFNSLPSTKLEVLLLRATFYTFLGKYEPAFKDLECILNMECAADDVKINALLKTADLHLEFMNLDMAFMNFELAISINPHCSDIYYRRGRIYMHMGELNKAKYDFEKALEYDPNFSMACIQKCYTDYRIAMLNKDVRLVEAAVRTFEKVLEKYTNLPKCIFCYQYYRKMMSKTHQYQKAHNYFTKIIKKHSDDTSMSLVYLQRAFLEFDWNGYSDKAVEYLKKAIELDEKCSSAYEALGIIEIKRGNIEEAIRLFDKALVYCRTFKELLNLYYLRDAAKVELYVKNQFKDKYSDFFGRYLGSRIFVLRSMEESVKGSVTIVC